VSIPFDFALLLISLLTSSVASLTARIPFPSPLERSGILSAPKTSKIIRPIKFLNFLKDLEKVFVQLEMQQMKLKVKLIKVQNQKG
jgi:hypothetical protein